MLLGEGFFAPLVDAFEKVPDLFCATAQIFFPEGERRQETGKAVMPPPARNLDFPVRCDVPAEGEDLSWVLYGSGGCSLYDAGKLRALGGFDEIFRPAYVEDLDLGFRGWQRGWPSVFVAGRAAGPPAPGDHLALLHRGRAGARAGGELPEIPGAARGVAAAVSAVVARGRGPAEPDRGAAGQSASVVRPGAGPGLARAVLDCARAGWLPRRGSDFRAGKRKCRGVPVPGAVGETGGDGGESLRAVPAFARRRGAHVQPDAARGARFRPGAGVFHRPTDRACAGVARGLRGDRAGAARRHALAAIDRAARRGGGVRRAGFPRGASRNRAQVAAGDRATRVHADGAVRRRLRAGAHHSGRARRHAGPLRTTSAPEPGLGDGAATGSLAAIRDRGLARG